VIKRLKIDHDSDPIIDVFFMSNELGKINFIKIHKNNIDQKI